MFIIMEKTPLKKQPLHNGQEFTYSEAKKELGRLFRAYREQAPCGRKRELVRYVSVDALEVVSIDCDGEEGDTILFYIAKI